MECEYVKIELIAEDTSVSNYVITGDTPNNSIYEWFISEDIMNNGFNLSTKYRIRITTLNNQIRDSNGNLVGNNGTLTAESDIYLEVILAPNVYFVLDDSGSMSWANPARIAVLKQRMNNAAVALAKNFNIGISGMNTRNYDLLQMKKGYTASEIRESYASLTASGDTPTGKILKEIRENKKYEISSDIYNEYRRKAVVVITDGEPANLQEAISESAFLADDGVPVFYMGINANSYSDDLQQMAVAGDSDNPGDPTRNWYPIDEDGQFEAALHEIMYGDLEVSGSMVKLEIDCGTPDSGNAIYFYGDTARLGNTTSPTNITNLYKATYENGKYYVKIRKQDGVTFSWRVVEALLNGSIVKIEKVPLHTSDDTSHAFNGWEEKTITILVAASFGFDKIHYRNCSNTTAYPNSIYPGIKMKLSGSDYVFTFSKVTSVEFLITKGNNDSDTQKLYGTGIEAPSCGTYRVTSSGCSKIN